MAATRDESHRVSWEDLLAVINPPSGREEDDIWRAIDEVTTALQDGRITYEEAAAFIKMLMVANLDYEIREAIAGSLPSNEDDNLESTPRRRRFSLV